MHLANVHFTSDPHINHKNILKWERTRFSSLDEMHHEMIREWNAHVKPNDIVYNCGDVSFDKVKGPADVTCEVLRQLNGLLIVHLKGNHDYSKLVAAIDKNLKTGNVPDKRHDFLDTPYHEAKVDKQLIIMSHYPIVDQRNNRHGSWMLHGHCHGSTPLPGKILDVGMDAVYKEFGVFRPISGTEVKAYMDKQEIEYYGHHKEL